MRTRMRVRARAIVRGKDERRNKTTEHTCGKTQWFVEGLQTIAHSISIRWFLFLSLLLILSRPPFKRFCFRLAFNSSFACKTIMRKEVNPHNCKWVFSDVVACVCMWCWECACVLAKKHIYTSPDCIFVRFERCNILLLSSFNGNGIRGERELVHLNKLDSFFSFDCVKFTHAQCTCIV